MDKRIDQERMMMLDRLRFLIQVKTLEIKIINEMPNGNDWAPSKGLQTYVFLGGKLIEKGFTVSEAYDILKDCFYASKTLFE